MKLDIYDGFAEKLKAVTYIHKKSPSQIFDWVLNTPLNSQVQFANWKSHQKNSDAKEKYSEYYCSWSN